ncbi:hypothetical protein ACJQWK_08604 [Exserohilum turcicum]|uniref:Uncharacterized protein n=1 Tax=Exserohilum turcicum (strain 28A) TaxID=671987 RepID=R0IPY6_EXST2|nr:uncharacterized protein SETTUDRAFT_31100 [Exserohilum turcica Et28A]EOA86781.1 hypothetical protein SETTUDRAFT_31100 [Exserohilum turcica Et28A]
MAQIHITPPPLPTPPPDFSLASLRLDSLPLGSLPKHSLPRLAPIARPISHVIQAHETKCGICFQQLFRTNMGETINHINACWGARIEKTARKKIKVCTENTREDSSEEKLHDTRIPIPILDSVISTPAQTALCPPHDATAETSCVLCCATLPQDDSLDTIHLLLSCLAQYRPDTCPMCAHPFRSLTEPQDLILALEHIYTLHYAPFSPSTPLSPSLSLGSSSSPPSTQHTFTDLIIAYLGRVECSTRLLHKQYGEKASWTAQQHQRAYLQKRRGRARKASV